MKLLILLLLAQPMEELQRHRNLGKPHYERGEYSLAVSELEKALSSDAVSGRDSFNVGMVYLQDQQEDRALSLFTTAGQVEPGLIEADFGVGLLHKRALRYPLALESLPKTQAPEKEGAHSLPEAFTKGTPSLSFRYRYENVGDDAFEKDAHASTLRTALGYRTLPYRGLSLFLQAQNVVAIGEDRFDNRGAGDLANGVTDRPAVVDPSETRMQQVYGRLEAFDTTFDLGRREIAYGDHRFVGDVNWRQNHQAFDALYLSNRSLGGATLSYAFADKVLRVDGGEKAMSSHFLNAVVELVPAISLELYSYLLDYDEEADAALSSQSYGGKVTGSRPFLEKHRLLFEAQYAKQLDFAANPAERDADYLHLVGGVGVSNQVTLKVGRELLGGSPEGGAFQTPLATLFKFNGWADKFLTTPPGGLIDWYVSGEGRLRSLGWIAAYHDFRADTGNDRYGSELDARAVFSTSWKQSFGFQVAFYRADHFSTDTRKVWLWTEYSF